MEEVVQLRNAEIWTPERSDARTLTFQGRRILAIGEASGLPLPDRVYDAQGGRVVPGLIDTHLHGGDGADSMEGTVEAVYRLARAHAYHGTTAVVPAVFAAPMERIERAMVAIGEAARNPIEDGARVLGAHIEGKFGSPQKRGAHEAAYLEPPTIEAFQRLWKASGGEIRIFSYAVELDEDLRLTRYLAQRAEEYRLVPAIGHTDADYPTARAAIEAGVRWAVHLYNAMSGHHRRQVGALEAVLEDPRVHAELIADGRHVHRLWGLFAFRLKGAERMGLITDALYPAALRAHRFQDFFERDPATGFWVSREERELEGEVTRRRTYWIDGALYIDDGAADGIPGKRLTGSVITLAEGLKNAISWGLGIAEAVRAATASPADGLGLRSKGYLARGYDADIVVFDTDWNVRAVWVEGRAIRNELPLWSSTPDKTRPVASGT